MLDVDALVRDLIRMRGKRTQRGLARKMRVVYKRVQSFEKRDTKILDLEFIDAWLNACDSSLAIYFSAKARAQELETIRRNNETINRFVTAMKYPEHAAKLTGVIDAVLDREKLPGTDK